MAIFNWMSKNVDDIFRFIVTSDEMKKLLVNNSPDALSESVPTISFPQMIDKYLFDIPKLPDVESEVKSFIVIKFRSARKAGVSNIYQYNAMLYVDIVCHQSVWRLSDGSKRPYLMSDIIDRAMKTIETKSIRGNYVFEEWNEIPYNGEFQGFRFTYTITNPSQSCG